MSQLDIGDALAQVLESNERQRQSQVEAYLTKVLGGALENSYTHAGLGSAESIFEKTWSEVDRYGSRLYTPNKVSSGLTFITRPQLNLNSLNLRMNRFLSMLDTFDPLMIQFAIRASLDGYSRKMYYGDLVKRCPFLKATSPWFTILGNTLSDISGAPSRVIDTYTSDGGFYSESYSHAIGSDGNKKPIDLQLTFVDPQGGPVMAIMQYWMEYIERVTTGELIPHQYYVEKRRLDYTVSIYRLTLDPSRRYVYGWYKFTGCFPINLPTGAMFDMSRSEYWVEACKNFTVTFRCVVPAKPNDPGAIQEFNMLTERYCPAIKNYFGARTEAERTNSGVIMSGNNASDNYTGLPYIIATNAGPRLVFFVTPDEIKESATSLLRESESELAQINSQYYQREQELRQQFNRVS